MLRLRIYPVAMPEGPTPEEIDARIAHAKMITEKAIREAKQRLAQLEKLKTELERSIEAQPEPRRHRNPKPG